jgi:hypothetical protein
MSCGTSSSSSSKGRRSCIAGRCTSSSSLCGSSRHEQQRLLLLTAAAGHLGYRLEAALPVAALDGMVLPMHHTAGLARQLMLAATLDTQAMCMLVWGWTPTQHRQDLLASTP